MTSADQLLTANERVVHVVVVVVGQPDLLEIIDALDAAGGLAGRLDGRQQQRDQDGDDRNHDESNSIKVKPLICFESLQDHDKA